MDPRCCKLRCDATVPVREGTTPAARIPHFVAQAQDGHVPCAALAWALQQSVQGLVDHSSHPQGRKSQPSHLCLPVGTDFVIINLESREESGRLQCLAEFSLFFFNTSHHCLTGRQLITRPRLVSFRLFSSLRCLPQGLSCRTLSSATGIHRNLNLIPSSFLIERTRKTTNRASTATHGIHCNTIDRAILPRAYPSTETNNPPTTITGIQHIEGHLVAPTTST